ncbi:hypothetical protein KBX71_23970 [Micromonospora sp. D93]|uniref:hypothetical protein n=1 Tax=Micromonospora sp. D93 TaxID=2824886 RepID=UPI001B37B4FE|nr:hypothetical protein [Micromonospora sp. D93]MBQ1020912.1 hypothetical protein [Micromonospora sp. D93]
MNEPAEVTMPVRVLSWLGVAAATVIAAAAAAGFWWLAVPRFDVCAAVLPARAGCRIAGRVSTATLWTAVVVVFYVATVVVALARPRGRWWPLAVGIALLIVAALWGYRAVLYQT